MRCGHKLRRFEGAIIYAPHVTTASIGTAGQGWSNVPGQHRCDRCHEVIPLGPSADSDPRVAVEVDAAYVASRWGDGAYWLTVEAMSATGGRNQEVIGLAREILEHDAEQGEGLCPAGLHGLDAPGQECDLCANEAA